MGAPAGRGGRRARTETGRAHRQVASIVGRRGRQQGGQVAWPLALDYALLGPVKATPSHPDAQPLG
jgi:thiamine monophosphate synthase